jgi:hypothetical protein
MRWFGLWLFQGLHWEATGKYNLRKKKSRKTGAPAGTGCAHILQHLQEGFVTLPMKRTVPVLSSRIRKTNG